MTRILLTNDDSYRSVGFRALLKELSVHHEVLAIVPNRERSWIGKSITKMDPLKLTPAKVHGNKIHICDGTPADCVQIGLYHFPRPDLVVSGINHGWNLGQARIISSGTMGAAFEASIDHVPAIASSLGVTTVQQKEFDLFDPANEHLFSEAASITRRLIARFMSNPIPPGLDVLSLNIPFLATRRTPLTLTWPARERYGKLFHLRSGRYHHKNPPIDFSKAKKGSDLRAIREGRVSVTPLTLDFSKSHHRHARALRSLMKG
ncbi:MAG: 5'/3'-nucleotidase SurE [Nanoarchaeota archaeon]